MQATTSAAGNHRKKDNIALPPNNRCYLSYYNTLSPPLGTFISFATEMDASMNFSGPTSSHNAIQGQQASGSAAIHNNFYGLNTSTEVAVSCRRDLFVTDPSEDKQALKGKKGDHARGTCKWMLDTEEFRSWLGLTEPKSLNSQDSRILWLHGNPGTGKSTMAIFLVDSLISSFSQTQGKTLAYFFCDSSFDTRKTATSILRGLIYQLIEKHPQLLNYLLPKYQDRQAGIFTSFYGLWEIFLNMSSDQTTGQKYFIIDALDECDEETQVLLSKQLQKYFQEEDPPPNTRILVTSRPYRRFFEALGEFPQNDLASFPQARQDIELFIEEKIVYLSKTKRYTPKVKGQISAILRDKAEGTFLWVGLACKELEAIDSRNAACTLHNMPQGLDRLYKNILDSTLHKRDEEQKEKLWRILGFVAVCLRPFSLIELADACQLYEDEEDESTRAQFTHDEVADCRLMIIIKDEKVLLLHQSVKDFLASAQAGHFIDHLEAHGQLAYRCIDILISEHNKNHDRLEHLRQTKLRRTKFLEYAKSQWGHHARLAESRFEVTRSHEEFFKVDSPREEHWFDSKYRRFRGDELGKLLSSSSMLHVAAKWGIPALASYLSRSDNPDHEKPTLIDLVNVANYLQKTPIAYAIEGGYLDLVHVLLDMGAVLTGPVRHTTVRCGTKEVVALLLDKRASTFIINEKFMKDVISNPNAKDVIDLVCGRGNGITITEEVAVIAAATRNGKDLIERILDHRGNEIAITTEILKAAAGNHEGIVELLLDRRGNEITITEDILKAAAASWRGMQTIKLLLDKRGDEIDITEEIVKSAATSRYGKKTIELLLDKRGNEFTITEEVVKAAAGTHEGIVELLLDRRGNEIAITENILKAAAAGTSQGALELLLNHRGNKIPITEDILKAAAAGQHGKQTIELLLARRGDEIDITEEIVKAAAGNHEGIVELLLEHRCNKIPITEDILKSAAAGQYGKQTIELLLARRGDEIIITEEVVKVAVAKCDKGTVKLLLDRRGHDITITEDILKAAVVNPNGTQVAALLLSERGNEIIITEQVIQTTIENSQYGLDILRLLVCHPGQTFINRAIIKAAAMNSNGERVISLLLTRTPYTPPIPEEWITAAGVGDVGLAVQQILRRRNERYMYLMEIKQLMNSRKTT